jgi:hypothetical protein
LVSVHRKPSTSYVVLSEGGRRGFVAAVQEISPAPKPRLLDRVRAALFVGRRGFDPHNFGMQPTAFGRG